MTREEQIIYLAGIVDGEGHFYKPDTVNGRGEHHRYSRINVVQKDKRLLEWIKARFGGSISTARKSQVSEWSLQGKKAESLARELQPFLIVKDEQVKRII